MNKPFFKVEPSRKKQVIRKHVSLSRNPICDFLEPFRWSTRPQRQDLEHKNQLQQPRQIRGDIASEITCLPDIQKPCYRQSISPILRLRARGPCMISVSLPIMEVGISSPVKKKKHVYTQVRRKTPIYAVQEKKKDKSRSHQPFCLDWG